MPQYEPLTVRVEIKPSAKKSAAELIDEIANEKANIKIICKQDITEFFRRKINNHGRILECAEK